EPASPPRPEGQGAPAGRAGPDGGGAPTTREPPAPGPSAVTAPATGSWRELHGDRSAIEDCPERPLHGRGVDPVELGEEIGCAVRVSRPFVELGDHPGEPLRRTGREVQVSPDLAADLGHLRGGELLARLGDRPPEAFRGASRPGPGAGSAPAPGSRS